MQAQAWRIFTKMLKTVTGHVLNLDKLYLVLEKQHFASCSVEIELEQIYFNFCIINQESMKNEE